jgi:hypothetical protein
MLGPSLLVSFPWSKGLKTSLWLYSIPYRSKLLCLCCPDKKQATLMSMSTVGDTDKKFSNTKTRVWRGERQRQVQSLSREPAKDGEPVVRE